MRQSLRPHAAAALEAVRSLDRALEAARPGWNDAKRQSFDQQYADGIVAAGRRIANDLASLSEDLEIALSSVRDTDLP